MHSGFVVLNHDIAIMSLSALVDASKTSLFLSLGSITFNPTAWNIVARNGKSFAPWRPLPTSHACMTDPFPFPRRRTQKNTATRRSLAFLAAMLIRVVTSSQFAFSVRTYCVITCTSPHHVFLCPSFSPLPHPIHPSILSQPRVTYQQHTLAT